MALPAYIGSQQKCSMSHRYGATFVECRLKATADVRHAVQFGKYTSDSIPPFLSQMAVENILSNPHHVLHKLLSDKTDETYNLRMAQSPFFAIMRINVYHQLLRLMVTISKMNYL